MKINEGMYVRTKDGFIDKVTIDYKGYCNSPTCNCKHVSCEHNYYDEDEIIKVSHSIIDLIEVGDYVNGYKVKAVYLKGYRKYIKLSNAYERGKGIRTYNEDIKTIVTKRVFESMKYEIK